MKTKILLTTLATALVVLFVGCKKDDFEEKIGICPEVISTIPTNGAVGVPVNQVISVTFNENMNPATITQTSFSLTEGTVPGTKGAGLKIAGTLTYDGTTPTFTFEPTTALTPNTTYTGKVARTAKDMMGNALQADYIWSFKTAPQQFAVALSSNPVTGGTTTGSGSYVSGSTVNITATPNAGYTFVNWTEGTNILSTNAAYSFTIEGNRTLVANFTVTIVNYTVTLSSFPVAGGTTTGGGSYVSGSSVTITATPATGYTFMYWTEGTNVVSTDASYIFTITSNRTFVASFTETIINYTVTLSSNPAAGGATSGAGTYISGASVSVGATPNAGYTFTNWTEGGTVVSTNANYNFTITGNRTLVANFTETVTTFVVTLSSDPIAGGTTVGGGTYNSGASVIVIATPNVGYTFTNWTEGGSVVSTHATYAFTLTGNRTLVANFTETAENFIVSLSSNPAAGGSTTGGGSYVSGSLVTINATPNLGYTFLFWTEGESIISKNAGYSFTITANRTLVAIFTETVNNYTVTLSSNPPAGGSTSGGGTFTSGSTVTVTATPNTGYTFMYWTEGANVVSTSLDYSFSIITSRVLVANFSEIADTYTVAVSSNPTAGGSATGGGSFTSGASVTVTATPNDGFVFTNWTEGAIVVSSNAAYTFNIAGNRILVANFTAIIDTYTLTVIAVNGTVVKNPDQAAYNSGTSVQLTAIPNAGYTFTSWNGDASGSANPLTVVMNSNKTITANFTAVVNTYTLIVNAVNGTVVKDPDQAAYNSGTSVVLTATPNAGYTFTGWSGDATGSVNPLTVVMNANKNITANFTAVVNTYTLVVNAVNGTVVKNPDQAAYNSGTTVVLTATPNAGYTFTGWSGDATGSLNPLTVVMNANKNITAIFTAIVNTYTLTVVAVNGSVVKNPDQAAYNSGTSVVLTATPDAGYTFTGWSGDATGSLNPLTVIMDANKTITANFTKDPIGPGHVNLGTAGDFAVLTKSGISTTGVTSITGDIGVSPAAASSITGFGLIMDATNEFSRSPGIVVGKVYAANYAAPTPTKMTTAISDMEAAFTAAMGLVLAPIVELYAGNLNGQTLAPGLYKWSTGVSITTGITLAGGPDDTWVFQISQDLTVANSAIITLSGGAKVENIVWVVAGQAVLGTDVDFSGIILSQTLISLNSGARVTGRLLAQTAVTIIGSTIIQP